ncbi:MAG: glutamate--tRNA ligase [Candidatus Magasanikbacteria bacterium RIFOXYD2_FULL_39_9]|uniref:Glutamate--tRNA ligase n=1 Tax=Candidatus Magasanikbacteria bacterium RIFOXYD1_FULL_40_23 TaxID=1798705 RepID=A0A1F6PAY1_9BACT|nr:MAG: glutamate--tRNA ligase [Candidatus Magasanikbacteria bacterium RIFOXYD2_FULL_39_9]OGH93322.1 MAG: glutamate--tRNA ligase [Candidatus Magasanikbacteria bacterium RIFOXYD1_FULL_40_23]
MVKTRFAPSPTGYLHVGGLRTALYSYLFAKKHGGKFLLRIEDTDRERYVADGVANILKSLYWAGIVPDEGVTQETNGKTSEEGKNGPYTQSERLDIYKEYSLKLLETGHAYYCFCTSERLEKLRADQQARKMPTGYDGLCAKLDPAESKQKAESGEKHVMRLKMDKHGETVFNDLIRGEVRFKNELVDDQVLIKSDGFPTYHFAVVVDDHLMGITHIIRGEEWISSVPKHVQLYKYFGWEIPEMAHLPLLLNPDKSKLSKRQGDVAVEDYMKKGYLPEALVNFVAFLGWNPGTEKEMYSLEELIADFDLSHVGKTGGVFNLEKLDWYNKQYIKNLSNAQLVETAKPWLKEAGIYNPEALEKAVDLERERITTLAELPGAIQFVFDLPGYAPELLVWKKSSIEEVRNVLPQLVEFYTNLDDADFTKEKLEEQTKSWITEKGFSVGSVLWPMRVALSGQENSPGPFEIAAVLGKAETTNRLSVGLKKII